MKDYGVEAIGYLTYDYASVQPFGKKTYADVDSFHKAIDRCREHEDFVCESLKNRGQEVKAPKEQDENQVSKK